MAAGDHRAVGTATLPATGPGIESSIAVAIGALADADSVIITPSHTAVQTISDAEGPFQFYIVKTASTGFSIFADRGQVPTAILFDYVVRTST